MIYPKTKEFQKSLTPDEAVKILKEGNKRFIEKTSSGREYLSELSEASPSPWAVIHRCMDSRVLPEIIFDVGIGDVFVTGIAGNIINDDITGSMEFACEITGAKVILILGHTKCIAVESAINNVEMGKVTLLLEKIAPAADELKEKHKNFSTEDRNFVNDVTVLNVKNSIEHLRSSSKILSDLEKAGEIKIAGAIYDVATGKVTFLD